MLKGRIFFSIFLIITLFFQPVVVTAQPSSSTTAQVRQRFNPNATIQSTNNGRTFSGLSFSGVGGAVAGCTDLGGTISGGIGKVANIFKSKGIPKIPVAPGPAISPNATVASGSTQNQLRGLLNNDPNLKTTPGISNTSNPVGQAIGATSSQEVPTTSKKTDAELKKANQRESCLNGVAYAVAKGLLRQVTDKTLNWVNTGFNGNPLYVRNIDSFMRTISNERIALFLDNIPSRDPVFGNSIRSIVNQQLTGISDGLIGTVMDTPEARAYNDFQEDFTNGGWPALLNPRNNAVGAIFNAADELNADISQQQQNVKEKLQSGDGFLDLERCVQYADDQKVKYPYNYKQFWCPRDIQKEWTTYYNNCVKNTTSANPQTSCRYTADQIYDPDALTSCITPTKADSVANTQKKCLVRETVTPGAIISAQVSTVTTSSIRQLEQADQINEVLGAFFDQLLNKLLSDGLASLRGRSNSDFSFTGIGSNTVLGNNGGIISSAQAGATALGYQQAGSGYNEEMDISRPQHLQAILQAQYDYLNRLRDARITLNRITPTLGALDYCIPGPNPTWTDGLDENVSNWFSGLQPITKEPSTFETILLRATIGILSDLFSAKPHGVAGLNILLFDKVTNASVKARPSTFWENNRSPEVVLENIQFRWEELMTNYNRDFTPSNIIKAFMSVDPSDPLFAQGFAISALQETAKLPQYAAASFEIDAYYETAESETLDAIAELEDIRAEANKIVATAKARHIAEQAAAGTPVNRACLDDAYIIDTSPIVPVARQEAPDPSPFFDQFIEASNYFYSNL